MREGAQGEGVREIEEGEGGGRGEREMKSRDGGGEKGRKGVIEEERERNGDHMREGERKIQR